MGQPVYYDDVHDRSAAGRGGGVNGRVAIRTSRESSLYGTINDVFGLTARAEICSSAPDVHTGEVSPPPQQAVLLQLVIICLA